MKRISHNSYFFLLLFFLTLPSIQAKPLFYRSHNPTLPLPHDIKKSKKYDLFLTLSSCFGSTKEGKNSSGAKVNFPNIYGNYNMNKLGSNTNLAGNLIDAPTSDPDNHYIKLQNLTPLTGTNNFGYVSFSGELHHFEYNLQYIKSFKEEFEDYFITLNIPIRKLEIKDTVYTDLTPSTGNAGLNQLNANWTNFLASFDNILGIYDLTKGDVKKTGLGDAELLVGVAHKSNTFSFLEVIAKAGITTCFGKKKDEDKVFSLANGHDGHKGIISDLSLFITPDKSCTLQIGGGGTVFFNKTKNIRMVTDPNQSGFIKLAKGVAERKLGNLWHFETLFTFQPEKSNSSISFGYSFQGQGKSQLFPVNQTIFNSYTVNTDAALKKWHMHSIHTNIIISSAVDDQKEKDWHMQFFYSKPLKGKYIANMDTFGGTIGMDITYIF